ncbi:MAG: hypothetical protein E6J14_03610 [Chloroflexi bacterium]|nr:MAG: hypothetical protein E6J14_03610 [Chloroflexota bacterium]
MDRESARQRLEAERARLEEVRRAADHLVEGVEQAEQTELSSLDQHPADVGSEVFERERDLGVMQQVRQELDEVQSALRRLDDGRYGVCEVCGRPISDERLEVKPAARYCVDDQARLERGARLRPQ